MTSAQAAAAGRAGAERAPPPAADDSAAAPAAATGVDLLSAFRVLRLAGAALWNQAQLHGQLAGLEWQQEKSRLLRMLLIVLLGFAGLLCALLFAGGLLLAAAWDTAYRLPAFAALALAGGAGAALAWRKFKDCAALSGRTFAASRAQLAADAAVLKAYL